MGETWAEVQAYPLCCQCGQPLPLPDPNTYVVCSRCETRYWATVRLEEEPVIGHCPHGHALYDHSRINGQCAMCVFTAMLADREQKPAEGAT